MEHEVPGVLLCEGVMPGQRMTMSEVTLADEVNVNEWFEHEAPQHQPQNDAVMQPRHEGYVGNACAQGDGENVLESHFLEVFNYAGSCDAMVVSGRHALCFVSHTLTQPWFAYASPIQSATLSPSGIALVVCLGREEMSSSPSTQLYFITKLPLFLVITVFVS